MFYLLLTSAFVSLIAVHLLQCHFFGSPSIYVEHACFVRCSVPVIVQQLLQIQLCNLNPPLKIIHSFLFLLSKTNLLKTDKLSLGTVSCLQLDYNWIIMDD